MTVKDPDTGNDVVIEILKDQTTGAMVGLDASYLENTELPVYDPYNVGHELDVEEDSTH